MCSLLLILDHLVVLVEHHVPFPLQLLLLSLKHLILDLFLLEYDVRLFVFKLKAIQVVDQMGVLFRLDIVLNADARLILARVSSQRSDGSLHVVQLLVELFNCFRVALFRIVLVGHLTFDVILVEFHQSCDVCLIILKLYDFLHVLCEFKDDCFLLLCLFFLLRDINCNLVVLRLMFPQLIPKVCDL